MSGQTDPAADLLLRAQQGDGDALGRLLDEQRALLHRLADQWLDDRIRGRLDASDLVQQTCLSAYRKIDEFAGREPAQFVAWLKQVHEHNVRNAVRDHLQAGRRAATRDRPLEEFDAADRAAETPSRQLIREESHDHLREALENLPPDEREALRLRFIEGRTVADISAQMDLTRDALMWLMQRGLRRIRAQIPSDSQS